MFCPEVSWQHNLLQSEVNLQTPAHQHLQVKDLPCRAVLKYCCVNSEGLAYAY